MKKKLIMLCSILLLLGCLIFSQNNESRSFSVLNPVSADRVDEIKNYGRELSDSDFSCLLCNDIRVPFDSVNKTFYISVDMEQQEWEKFCFESGQPEYEIIFPEDLQDYNKTTMIAEGTKFPLLVYNETGYAQYYLTFSGLPLIDLSTDVGIWQENIQGTAVFYDTDFASHGVIESEYNGHLRGNTSRMYPKKGYKLNLVKKTASGTLVNNHQSLFGLREDDDWILYAMYNDETKLRDSLCIDLWNSFGAHEVENNAVYGTNLTYVEVIADNSYCGLYGLMEPIDGKQLNLNAEDYLYKRKNPHGLNYEKFADATDPYAEVNGFEIKEGEKTSDAWTAIAEFSYFLNSTSDTEFLENVSRKMDTDNALRMWLFIQIITGHDQRAKNVYYVAKQEKEGVKFYFAPWDMDLTWGNVSVGEENPLYTDFEMETYNDDIPWETADRLIFLNADGSAEKMQQLYSELRSGILSDENLEQHILEQNEILRNSGAYDRDWQRWPEGAHSEDCELLILYAKARLEFLDQALFDLENYD